MQITVQVPKAFSVRDENEFHAFQHLMARMHPDLRVHQVATGVHVNGGCTVFWGIVSVAGQKLSPDQLATALQEAGFDARRSGALPTGLPFVAHPAA